jgi:hypothetical protein
MWRVKIYDNRRLLCANEEIEVYYKKGKLIVSIEKGKYEEKAIIIPCELMLKLAARFRILERIFRVEVKNAIIKDETIYFTFHGYVYKCIWKENRIQMVHQFRKGMNNPRTLCNVTQISTFTDGVIYGEYWGNAAKERVNIYKEKGEEWECVYTFPPNTITHIHGFALDREHGRILIMTGDTDEGSGIWETKDDFKTVKPLLVGKQQYRCCVAFPCEEGILYATDTPLEKNYLYFMKENESEKRLIRIQELPGPCIYGRTYIDKIGKKQYVFATSVEPDSRIKGLRYLLTYRLGQGVQNRNVHIWMGNEEDGFKEIFHLKKDLFPMGLFQFGNVQFPDSPQLIVTGQAVKKFDTKTMILEEKTDENPCA